MNAVHIARFIGEQALMAETAGRLKAVPESVAAPFSPLVALMLRSTAQAAKRPAEESPPLTELVAQARWARASDRDDLAMIAMASLVTGQNREACERRQLVAGARTQGGSWLPAMVNCLAQTMASPGGTETRRRP